MSDQEKAARDHGRQDEAVTPAGHPECTPHEVHFGTSPVDRHTGIPIDLAESEVYELRIAGGRMRIPVTLHRLSDGRVLLYRTRVVDGDTVIGWVSCEGWRIAEVILVDGVGLFTDFLTAAFDWEDLQRVPRGTYRHEKIVRLAHRPMLLDLGIEIGGAR